ncbi:uncharacterized protein DUF4043 [Sphingomonas faeni]|uniref:Uncharacterized protein DUF4043 n=1 Tax=Sphingomonas faeni TaxID=185950 RepID=A0A2T5U287_9SPHN|nr:DUF4043 family protein [Sphingomonas faeni]PTW45592.1 uncharacterized protein DUF4043 [Sphingomonas faeni]
MANFKLVSANEKQVWSEKYALEYVRTSALLPYMSTASNAIIRMDKQLGGQAGAVIHFPYFAKLQGAGVTGGATLMGNEENLRNYSTAVRASLRRNGVKIQESETFKTELDIYNIARSSLIAQSAENLRNDVIVAGQSVIVPGGNDTDGNPLEDTYVPFATSSVAQKNAWLVANTDRVLFGNKRANSSSGVFATALATVDATQKLSAGVINMAKAMAKKSAPFKITPYRSDATAGREWFVLFVDSEGFRDLSVDPIIYAANKDSRERGLEDNVLLQGGDLIYNGVIIRELTELTTAAAGVGHALLCGVGALAVGVSKMPEPRVQAWDYGMENNVAVVEIRGQAKCSAAGVQTGIVSIFHASTPDA